MTETAAPPPEAPPSAAPDPIKLLLALITIVLAAAMGHVLSEQAGMSALRVEASHRLDLFASAVNGVVNRLAHVPATLELNHQVRALLYRPQDTERAAQANHYLEELNRHLGSVAVFVLDDGGVVRASSNWNQTDSFVGEDLSFRDYFRSAQAGQPGRHFAIGTTRGAPGYFVSHPVRDGERVMGVAVIKIGLEGLDEAWRSLATPALIADHNGVVILSSEPGWLYTALEPLEPEAGARAHASQLYNRRTIAPFPVALPPQVGAQGQVVTLSDATARAGTKHKASFLVLGRPVPQTGWWLMVFSDLRPMHAQALSQAALAGTLVGFFMLLLAFLAQRRRILRQQLEAKAMLERANRELEATVATRTEALIDSNTKLRREIQEREQAEKTLRAAQDELVQAAKLAVLGQLATGITHELNQPLGAIRTLAGNAIEFLRRGNVDTASNNLAIINRLVDQMGSIITPLKSFARKSPAIPVAVRVDQAVANALFLLEQRLQRKGIRVIDRCAGSPLAAWCDQNRLEQVLVNLIGNAADAMGEAELRELSLSTCPGAPGMVEICVADTGPGLPEAVRQRLFEPFFTTKPAGEGLGLGLAISRDIMRDFGGDLIPGNAPGGGASFRLVLPAHSPASSP